MSLYLAAHRLEFALLVAVVTTALATYPLSSESFTSHADRRDTAMRTLVGGGGALIMIVLGDSQAANNPSAWIACGWAVTMLIGLIVVIELTRTVSVDGVTLDGRLCQRSLWRGDQRRKLISGK